ncbi:MAG: MOSC N-terminal beta barrel domain-containing protein [Pirellulales bacterium]|nr:MOSC N-terminal beta barrel domain-containing protein [Pirellulales bacterium]
MAPSVLEQIWIYPIKSLDGVRVDAAAVLPSGALAHDRRWALVDAAGPEPRPFVNAKQTARIHALRAQFELDCRKVRLQGDGREFQGTIDAPESLAWLSAFFGREVGLVENAATGWPDDTEASGPTIVSRGTLASVGEWFEGWATEEATRRFRPNLVLAIDEPFWEDRLYGPGVATVRFRIGAVEFEGTNPCQRCVVPSRQPQTGIITSGFARRFAEQREATLPGWAARDRFDHFYRLTVNTRLAPGCSGGTIRCGDRIEIVE